MNAICHVLGLNINKHLYNELHIAAFVVIISPALSMDGFAFTLCENQNPRYGTINFSSQ